MNKPAIILFGVGMFAAGGTVGFLLGVASVDAGRSFLEDLVTTEQPAELAAPRRHERPAFDLSYPSNWRLDDKDEDYDPDHLLSIESPGSAVVTVSVSEVALDPETMVAAQREALQKLMPSPAATPLSRWGAHDGVGVRLEGRLLGMKGTIVVFAAVQGERSFAVVTQLFDEDRAMVQPGFDLVERTFRLR